MPNQEAQTVEPALDEIWISRFGCPVNLHNLKGTTFVCDLIPELCRILGIERTSTTLFHSEENAMNKKTNKVLQESHSKYEDDHQHEWKSYPRLVLIAYRSSGYGVTKKSPSYEVLEKPLRLAID